MNVATHQNIMSKAKEDIKEALWMEAKLPVNEEKAVIITLVHWVAW